MSYREIYDEVLNALTQDNFFEESRVWAAKRITDALWQVNLMLNSNESGSLTNTINAIKRVIVSRI